MYFSRVLSHKPLYQTTQANIYPAVTFSPSSLYSFMPTLIQLLYLVHAMCTHSAGCCAWNTPYNRSTILRKLFRDQETSHRNMTKYIYIYNLYRDIRGKQMICPKETVKGSPHEWLQVLEMLFDQVGCRAVLALQGKSRKWLKMEGRFFNRCLKDCPKMIDSCCHNGI